MAFDGDLMSIYFGPLSDTCGYNANPFNPGPGYAMAFRLQRAS